MPKSKNIRNGVVRNKPRKYSADLAHKVAKLPKQFGVSPEAAAVHPVTMRAAGVSITGSKRNPTNMQHALTKAQRNKRQQDAKRLCRMYPGTVTL